MEKKVIFIIIGVIIVGAISSYLIYDMIGLKTEETGTEGKKKRRRRAGCIKI